MPRLPRQSQLRQLLRSRILTMTLLVVAAAMSLAVGRELARRVTVQQELDRLKGEITRAERSTDDLERLIATLNSSTYEESAARTTLNLQKPGENVLVIPGSAVNSPEATTPSTMLPSESAESNSARWWNFLFKQRSS